MSADINRPVSRIVFACLTAFVLLPNMMAVFMAVDLLGVGQRLVYAFTALCFYAIGLCLLRKRAFLYTSMAFFLLSAVEIVHLIINQATTSLLFCFTCIKSEKGEFLELLSSYWIVVVVFFALWGVYASLTKRYVPNEYIAPRVPRMIALAVSVAFLLIVSLRLAAATEGDDSARASAWTGAQKVCPLNMAINVCRIAELSAEIDRHEHNLERFSFGIQPKKDDMPETFVLIIGETARYDHWQLNGYARPTSPYLSGRTDELVSFDSCYSIANLTTVSVPFMLSRATPENPRLYMDEKSVVEAFGEAGFRTAWIADQSFNNNFLKRIAAHCDYARYVYDDGSSPLFVDSVLLTPLDKLLAQNNTKQMIVLHSLGCHFKYSARYPERFDIFTPDLKTFRLSQINHLKTLLTNSYDNAICYTDYFINEVIRRLEHTGRPVVLMYVGDHGENLLDDDRHMFLHGTYSGSVYEYHVPLFVWMSGAYMSMYPDKLAAMRGNQSKKMSTMNLFHSMLDLMDIHSPYLDYGMSIASPDMTAMDTVYGLDANMLPVPIPFAE